MTADTMIRNVLNGQNVSENLYKCFSNKKSKSTFYYIQDLGEEMAAVMDDIWGWWKPRVLLDHRAKRGYLFMDSNEHLVTVTDNDINWNSLRRLPNAYIERAKAHDGHFPTLIRGDYHGGRAEVEWQLNPDGRYYMDEDGFGMTDDEEISLWGKIDRTGKVVVPFTYRKK